MRKVLSLFGLAVVLSGCGGGGTPPIPRVNNFSVEGYSLRYMNAPIYLKGVGYSPYRSPESANYGPIYSGFSLPNDDRYTGDLTKIRNMNGNFVIVFPPLMPPGFFSSLRKTDLVYAQEIPLKIYEDHSPGAKNDLLDPQFQQDAEEEIRQVIDHTYRYGAPDRLVYFSIGDEINPGVLANTDASHPATTSYQGNFIKQSGRTPTEIAMIQLMDYAKTYEMQTYHIMHLYTQTSYTHLGPVARPGLEVDLSRLYHPDFGDIMCMNIYTYGAGVANSQPGTVTKTAFQGYIEDLEKLARIPVIISQTGQTTSPHPDPKAPGKGGVTSDQVGQIYRQIWADVSTSQLSDRITGMAIFEFQDEFWKGCIGDACIAPDPSIHDPDQPEQWFGLFRLVSGGLSPKGTLPDVVRDLYGSSSRAARGTRPALAINAGQTPSLPQAPSTHR